MKLVGVFLIGVFSLSLTSSNKLMLKGLRVSLGATPESAAYIATLSDSEKYNWMQNLPDSIPLNLSYRVEVPGDFDGIVNVFVGTYDDGVDIFKGSYDIGNNTSDEGIKMSKSGDLYSFKLGKFTRLNSLHLTTWLVSKTGDASTVVKYVKK